MFRCVRKCWRGRVERGMPSIFIVPELRGRSWKRVERREDFPLV